MNIRTKTCPSCGKHFSYEIKRGTDRKHCSKKCRVETQLLKRKERFKKLPICKTSWCNRKANRTKAGMCEACYYQIRRKGIVEKPKQPTYRYMSTAGYVFNYNPNHPLSTSRGNVFEHRQVIYDKNKGVCPSCYWCGVELQWETIVIDHLNENKSDNRYENLVPSCNNCNRARGAMLPFVKRIRKEAIDTFFKRIEMVRQDGRFG